jgi:heme A synthase
MYDIVIKVHYIVSSIFFALALIVTIWAIIGWAKNLKAGRAFNRLSFFFIHFLYIQLITGIALYFFLEPDTKLAGVTMEQAAKQNELRFWAIEHVSLMLFALLLSQVGRLLIKQLNSDRKKFRTASLYFGVSFIVVLTSAALALFR